MKALSFSLDLLYIPLFSRSFFARERLGFPVFRPLAFPFM
jgi:hypothetical protein